MRHDEPSANPTRPRVRWSELWLYVIAVVLSLLGATWALRLWLADWHVPLVYYGDAIAVAADVKTTLQTGWYEHQPLLGWPAGQTFHDFPMSDDLSLLVMKVMGLVLRDWALTLNAYFVLGFALTAITALYFFRRVGLNGVPATVLAVLFSLAPYHFSRNESHLFLASYWVIPPAMLVVLRLLRGEPVWRRDRARRGAWWLRGDARTVVTTLSLVLVAADAAYYGFFTLILIASAGLLAFLHHRDGRRLGGGVVAGVVVVGTMFLLMLPDQLYARAHGVDTGALARGASGAEVYALKFASLILPVPGHVFGPFASIRATYDSAYPLPSEQPALGLVAAAGFVGLLVVLLLQLARPRVSRLAQTPWWDALVSLATLTLIAFLFSTVGGFSSVISFLTPDIRGWNRMSIVIALLSLAGVGLVLGRLETWLRHRGPRRLAEAEIAIVAVVLLVGATLDQVSPAFRPDVRSVARAFASDGAWVRQVEATFGANAAVFQLPYMSFPESPALNGVYDTDQLKPFLHSDSLRWSGGAIKGRASSDWPATVAAMPTKDAARSLAAAGFSAVLLDTQALGTDEGRVQASWRDLLGNPLVVGDGGRVLVFDLRPVAAALRASVSPDREAAARQQVTEPTMLYPGTGVQVGSQAGTTVWAGADGVEVIADNAAPRPTAQVISLTLLKGPPTVQVTSPFGVRTLTLGVPVRWEVEVPPGRSSMTIDWSGPVTVSVPTVDPGTTPAALLAGG